MRLWTRGLGFVCAVGGALALDGGVASACGGCFSPPQTITAVNSHRMVISLSPTQTTLWDQIRYSGSPADFVWVLPVPSADAKVAIADADFFNLLEGQTTPVVINRNAPLQFAAVSDGSGGFGCGAAGDDYSQAASDSGVSGDAGVTIFNESVVGPYDTVTIGSEDAGALQTWLTDHGYDIPSATVPTLMDYINQKSVFIVLRLHPGAGVRAMQPVRVTYPGYMGTFPLKMVTVGAEGALGLTLWVIADQRYEAHNYGTRTIDPEQLVWDWNTMQSNYSTVFDATVERGGGRAWIAEYAQPYFPSFSTADTALALTSLRAPYLTRLRTRALTEHLHMDLELTPAADTLNLPGQLDATHEINRPAPPSSASSSDPKGCVCRAALGRRASAALAPGLLLFAVAMLVRRRVRRS